MNLTSYGDISFYALNSAYGHLVCKWLSENPVMTLPIKKRINTGLFIGRRVTLYIKETQVRDTTNEGYQRRGRMQIHCNEILRW